MKRRHLNSHKGWKEDISILTTMDEKKTSQFSRWGMKRRHLNSHEGSLLAMYCKYCTNTLFIGYLVHNYGSQIFKLLIFWYQPNRFYDTKLHHLQWGTTRLLTCTILNWDKTMAYFARSRKDLLGWSHTYYHGLKIKTYNKPWDIVWSQHGNTWYQRAFAKLEKVKKKLTCWRATRLSLERSKTSYCELGFGPYAMVLYISLGII
jgi:hypothetical protein